MADWATDLLYSTGTSTVGSPCYEVLDLAYFRYLSPSG